MIQAYRAKMRHWTVEVMPTMPEDQWKQFTQWVAEYGIKWGTPRAKASARLDVARKCRRVPFQWVAMGNPGPTWRWQPARK